MRTIFVALLVVAIGLAVYLWRQGDDAVSPPAPSGQETAPGPTQPSPAGGSSVPPGVPRAVATRPEAANAVTEDLADAPTAWLRVLDHDTGAPLAGCSVHLVNPPSVIGFTDERGLAALPLKERVQLMTNAYGYLLRMTPTRLGSSEREPQDVRLVRDRWSTVRRFELHSAIDGARLEEGYFRIVRLDEGGETGGPSRGDAVVDRAWGEHRMLAMLPVASGVAVCTGRSAQWLLLASGEAVRFTYPGRYLIEVAVEAGLTVARRIDILPASAGGTEIIRLDLLPGAFVVGTVGDGNGRPLEGARLERQGGDPLALVVTTNAAGAFAFGPLPPGKVTLLVRHPDHEPTAHGPIDAPVTDVSIALRPLPGSMLRGRVRGRPGLEPVAGATVSWTAAQRPPLATRTADDGTFQLATKGDLAGRLLISTPGWLPYEELVDPGAPFTDYDLLPGGTPARLAAGMTAVLGGVVLDAAGEPVSSVTVRWQPDRARGAVGMPSRRVLRGVTLELGLEATTRRDGTFALETDRFGPGTLSVPGSQQTGIAAEAIAGRTQDGYRLRQ